MKLNLPAIDPAAVPPRTTSAYPEVFRPRVLPREKRALGDALGLTQFVVNLTTLMPGKESSMRHYHSHEDELVFVLEGEVVLRCDEGDAHTTAPVTDQMRQRLCWVTFIVRQCDNVAEATGISRPTLTRIVNVPGYNTNTDTIAALCEYLNCTPCDLLEYVQPEKSGPKGKGQSRRGR